jgi:hypothetical protein
VKACVACAEDIKPNALLCRWCGTKQDNPEYVRAVSGTQAEQPAIVLEDKPVAVESALPWNKQVLDDRQNLIGVIEGSDSPLSEDSQNPQIKKPSYTRPGNSDDDSGQVKRNLPAVKVITIISAIALFVSGLAYTYNPDYRYQFDSLMTNLFSNNSSYYQAGFNDARKLGASQHQTVGYASVYCSLITDAIGLSEADARNEYLKGCMDYVTSP